MLDVNFLFFANSSAFFLNTSLLALEYLVCMYFTKWFFIICIALFNVILSLTTFFGETFGPNFCNWIFVPILGIDLIVEPDKFDLGVDITDDPGVFGVIFVILVFVLTIIGDDEGLIIFTDGVVFFPDIDWMVTLGVPPTLIWLTFTLGVFI